METRTTAVAESSPAPQTTEALPDFAAFKAAEDARDISAAKSPAASTPAPKTASAPVKDAEPAASATASKQEKKSEAATRLDEVLADLKRAGLTPAELKTFKREAAAAASAEPPAKPEQTAKPQGLVAPVKPTREDKNADGSLKYKTWEELEAARDEYFEKAVDFKAAKAVADDRQARAAEAQQNTLKQKVTEAKARYGEDAMTVINTATAALVGQANLNPVVRAMCDDSPVLVDVMYVLGSKPDDLAEFVEMTKTNPGLAVRKFALIEHLVKEELAKGTGTAAAGDKGAATGSTQRGEDGKFVSETKPATKKPAAPPPPDELNTRGSAPADALDAAIRDNDFAAFKAAEDARDLAKRRRA